MARTAQQIVALACKIARAPNFLADAGQTLNIVLGELAQTYDFDFARGVVNFVFNFRAGGDDFSLDFDSDFGPPLVGGLNSGPYALPTDWLRARRDDVFYTIDGVKYVMINVDMAEFDRLVQQAGLASYPQVYTVDLSTQLANSTVIQPQMYVWPPPSGGYPVTARYQRQPADIVAPETSAAIPWFPDQNYLLTRLAGEMMKITNDNRVDKFLGTSDNGAQGILNRYLKLANDDEDRAKTVTLDRRIFSRGNFNRLRNTKTIGW